MWKVVMYRFNQKDQMVGSKTQVCATKREALRFLVSLGIDTQTAKQPGNKNLISRVGHSYNVVVK